MKKSTIIPVDREETIWARTNTGTVYHAFLTSETPAMCRINIRSGTGAYRLGLTAATERVDSLSGRVQGLGVCPSCRKLAESMWNRADINIEDIPTDFDVAMRTLGGAEDRGLTEAHAEALIANDRFDEISRKYDVPAEPDWDGVAEALDSPVVMNALHAEAIEINVREDRARAALKSLAGQVLAVASHPVDDPRPVGPAPTVVEVDMASLGLGFVTVMGRNLSGAVVRGVDGRWTAENEGGDRIGHPRPGVQSAAQHLARLLGVTGPLQVNVNG